MSARGNKASIDLDAREFFQSNVVIGFDRNRVNSGWIQPGNFADSTQNITSLYNATYNNSRYFLRYGISIQALKLACNRATEQHTSVDEELVRGGIISQTRYGEIVADYLGINFNPSGPPVEGLLDNAKFIKKENYSEHENEIDNTVTQFRGWLHKPAIHIACTPSMRPTIEQLARADEINDDQLILTTQKALKSRVFISHRNTHLKNAVNRLRKQFPDFSAFRVVTSMQAMALVFVLVLALAVLATVPAIGIPILHVIGSFFYLALTIMRAFMILSADNLNHASQNSIGELQPVTDHQLPVYSVLVALYDEAKQVPELTKALSKIDWPKDRLQILLICEGDDLETIRQCEKYALEDYFEVVRCPPCQPRTKPKALDFALPLARGEFLVLYDAEDRPHPMQLKEAFTKFHRLENTACLQAPLCIHNNRQSWYSRMFAIEYHTLFSAILPVLEKWHSPFPLGGTSNHFRTKVLREIGAWDPYNVTEDADLGIRLARFGYDSGTIKCPTMEEAPPVFRAWFPQRTRWIKGWMQTFLVHMRNPLALVRDLGLRKTLFFHLVVTSVVISVLIHPIFFLSAGYYLASSEIPLQLDSLSLALISLDIFNLIAGYTTYAALSWLVLDTSERRHLRKYLIWIPLYWLMISFAGWRAFYQLFTKPFYWEKTEHGLGSSNPQD